MPICKFYQNGNCKNGNRCRFDHVIIDDRPARDRYNNNNNHQPNRTSFNSNIHQPEPRGYNTQQQYQQGQRPGRTPDYGNGPRAGRFFIDEAATRKDLIDERPEWRLSCYTGAGQGCTDAPKHLIGGDLEQSFEEQRMLFYVARDKGEIPQTIDLEKALTQQADLQVTTILNNMKGAIQYAVNGKREDGNRWSIVEECNKQTPENERGVFAKNARPRSQGASSGGFGSPATPSAFGQPSVPAAFGQSPAPTTFGQPSALSKFGQPSAPAAFGHPSTPSSFGQPSLLSQPPQFGNPSVPVQPSGFGQLSQSGQPAAFGSPSAPGHNPSPFGKPSLLGQTSSAFGQPTNLAHNSFTANKTQGPAFGSATPFGQAFTTASPFGQPSSQPVSLVSPFGQPSASAQTSPFGAPATNPSPFGRPSAPQQNPSPFGQHTQPQVSPFGLKAQTQASSFGQPSQPNAQSAFGQPAQSASTFSQSKSAFGPAPSPAASFNHPPANPSHFASPSPHSHSPNGLAASRSSTLIPMQPPARNSGPVSVTPQDVNAPPRPEDPPEELFEGEKAAFEEAYRWIRERGSFKDGIMPEVAPLHYWVGWGPDELKFQS